MITVARGAFLPHNEACLPNYLYIPADDVPEFQLEPYFGKCFDFIDKNLHRTNVPPRLAQVLVHCMAGISRSVTVVASYLMRKFRKTSEEALRELRRLRPIVTSSVS